MDLIQEQSRDSLREDAMVSLNSGRGSQSLSLFTRVGSVRD